MQLVIRADANDRIGAGHVMRCATLARAWIDGGFGTALLVGRVDLPFVNARLSSLGILAADFPAVGDADRLLLVDSYDVGVRRAAAELPARCRALVDDVGGEVPGGYSIIWHPHPDGDRDRYGDFSGAVITGSSTIPIRNDLPPWTGSGTDSDVAVTLGGGGARSGLVSALVQIARDGRFRFVASGGWAPSEWEQVASEEMWTRFARCSRLLTGGGGTVWEAAVVGIPTAIVQIASNQALVVEWAKRTCPVVRFDETAPADATTAALARALQDAAPLPRLRDGTMVVARRLCELARQQA